MANYSNLLATIAANIYTNHNNEVTAAMVKTAVDAMVASLGDGYQFAGAANPATNPGTPDEQMFYIASEAGTYTNFPDSNADPIEVFAGEVVALYGSGSVWAKSVVYDTTEWDQLSHNSVVTDAYIASDAEIRYVSGGYEVTAFRVSSGKAYRILCSGFLSNIPLTAVGFTNATTPTIGTTTTPVVASPGSITIPIDTKYTAPSDGWLCVQNSVNSNPVEVYVGESKFTTRQEFKDAIYLTNTLGRIQLIDSSYIKSDGTISSVGGYNVSVYEVKAGVEYTLYCPNFGASIVEGIWGFTTNLPEIGEVLTDVRISTAGTNYVNDVYTPASDGFICIGSSNNLTSVAVSCVDSRLIEKKEVKLQLYGDSITDVTWGDYESWASFADEFLRFHTAQIDNQARSGWYLCNAWDQHSAVWKIQQVLDVDTDVIVIFAGTNDWSSGGDCLGEFLSNDPDTVYGATRVIIEYVAANTNAQLIFCTPMQRKPDPSLPVNAYGQPLNSSGHTLEEYANAIKKVCEFYGTPCIDMYHTLGVNVKNYPRFTADGLHPNYYGDKMIAAKICNFIESILD